MLEITVVLGDLTTQDVDAVINAANSRMRGGGGVDGAIRHAGGPAVVTDCVARFPRGLTTGDSDWTTAGEMPARWVIHTVGPRYRSGQGDRGLLVWCYRRCLAVANELGAHTVAFPSSTTAPMAGRAKTLSAPRSTPFGTQGQTCARPGSSPLARRRWPL